MSAAESIPLDNLATRFDDVVRRQVRRRTQAPLRMRLCNLQKLLGDEGGAMEMAR